MTAQLVLAAGFRLQFHQPVARGGITPGCHRHLHRRQAAVVGHRRLRIFVLTSKFIGDFIQLFHQRVIQQRFVHQPAADDRMVALLDLMLFKLLRQQAARLARQPHQQDAGGGPVETMSGKNVLANLVAHGLHHHHFLVAIEPAAMHQPARGFVDRHQPVVLVDNLQHQACSPANSASNSRSSASMDSRTGWA